MEQGKTEKVSVHTRKSKSFQSSTSSAVVKACDAAEAMKARAASAKKEVQLKVEKAAKEAELQLHRAKLETELSALALQRDAAAAIAQAEVLEAAEELQNSFKSDSSSHKALQRLIATRTNEYVAAQAELLPIQTLVAICNTSPDIEVSEENYPTWNLTSKKSSDRDGEQKEDEAANKNHPIITDHQVSNHQEKHKPQTR